MTKGRPFHNSSFLLLPFSAIRRALIKAELEMANDEMRMPYRSFSTSTFEILPSNFASLPGQLFYSTQIPVCLWFLAKIKRARKVTRGDDEVPDCIRDRKGETLFINARKMGKLIDRVHRELTESAKLEQAIKANLRGLDLK